MELTRHHQQVNHQIEIKVNLCFDSSFFRKGFALPLASSHISHKFNEFNFNGNGNYDHLVDFHQSKPKNYECRHFTTIGRSKFATQMTVEIEVINNENV